MRPIIPLAAAAACLLATALPAQDAGPRTVGVTVQAAGGATLETGAGILRPRRGGECFVVAPQHVIGDDGGDVTERSWRMLGSADWRDSLAPVPSVYSTDVSILRIPRRVGRAACPDWDVDEVNRVLRRAQARATPGVVVPWTGSGAGARFDVDLVHLHDTQFTIRRRDGHGFARGQSGSIVMLDGHPVGMLVDVDTAGVLGRVLRLDYLERHIGPFFNPTPAPGDAVILLSLVAPGVGQMRTGRRAAGLMTLASAGGAAAFLYARRGEERVERTQVLPDGNTTTYFEVRPTRPLRNLTLVPLAVAGLASFVEAYRHAAKHHIPPEQTGAEASAAPRLRLRPDVRAAAGGGTAVQVAEIRF